LFQHYIWNETNPTWMWTNLQLQGFNYNLNQTQLDGRIPPLVLTSHVFPGLVAIGTPKIDISATSKLLLCLSLVVAHVCTVWITYHSVCEKLQSKTSGLVCNCHPTCQIPQIVAWLSAHEDTCIKWHLTKSIHDEDMQSPKSPQRSVFLKFSLSKCKAETRSFRSHDREDLISSDCQLRHVGQIIPGNYFVLNQQWFKAHLEIAKLQSMYNGYTNK
jgi:hypothetical protein